VSNTVYVVDAWNETTGVSVVRVFKDKSAAQRAWQRLQSKPGSWFGAVIKRAIL
jgi:hypothetical protein